MGLVNVAVHDHPSVGDREVRAKDTMLGADRHESSWVLRVVRDPNAINLGAKPTQFGLRKRSRVKPLSWKDLRRQLSTPIRWNVPGHERISRRDHQGPTYSGGIGALQISPSLTPLGVP